MSLLPKAANGDREAQNSLNAAFLFDGGLPSEILPSLRSFAEDESAFAQRVLARHLEFSARTAEGPSDPEWPHWLERAASGGDAEAQEWLAREYAGGRIFPTDFQEAARWFRAAADQGRPYARYRLGALCALGLGVDQDLGQAEAWLALATQQGEYGARDALAVLRGAMDLCCPAGEHPEVVETPQGRPVCPECSDDPGDCPELGPERSLETWKTLLPEAAGGDQRAQQELRITFILDGGMMPLEVEPLVRRFAESGSAFAQYALAQQVYFSSLGAEDHPSKSEWPQLLEQAALGGYDEAQVWLAKEFASGKHLPQSWKEAARWFTAAAEQGQTHAQYQLGVLYATGRGVDHDLVAAEECLLPAAEARQNGAIESLFVLRGVMAACCSLDE